MKLLWVSNAPGNPSGYGGQTAQVGRRLIRAGYDVEFAANDGTKAETYWEGALVRGHGLDQYSRDIVPDAIVRSRADRAVLLFDVWVYANDPFTIPTAGWVPVDHSPLPPSCVPWLARHEAIAMSRFGEQALKVTSAAMQAEDGRGFPVSYAPHAIESVFRPTPSDFRERNEIPDDAFLVGIVAANTGTAVYDRKGWGDMFLAMGEVMFRRPDVYLYVHSLVLGHQGIDLSVLAGTVGVPLERIRWADQYRMKVGLHTAAELAEAYTAMDVLLATSRGEGFGVPVIEAQACGTPAIVSNWTAQPELVGEPWDPRQPGNYRTPSGWIVEVDPDYDARHGAMFGKPRVAKIIAALDDAHRLRTSTEWGAMRDAAIAKAAPYDADAVFDTYWRPILAEWEQALEPAVLSRQQRRAKRRQKVPA